MTDLDRKTTPKTKERTMKKIIEEVENEGLEKLTGAPCWELRNQRRKTMLEAVHFIAFADTSDWDGRGTHARFGKVHCGGGEKRGQVTDCVSNVTCSECQNRMRSIYGNPYIEGEWAK